MIQTSFSYTKEYILSDIADAINDVWNYKGSKRKEYYPSQMPPMIRGITTFQQMANADNFIKTEGDLPSLSQIDQYYNGTLGKDALIFQHGFFVGDSLPTAYSGNEALLYEFIHENTKGSANYLYGVPFAYVNNAFSSALKVTYASGIKFIQIPNATQLQANTGTVSGVVPMCAGAVEVSFKNATKISAGTFASKNHTMGCSELKSVYVPNVKDVGAWAFQSCISLKYVDMTECTTAGTSVFKNCSNLAYVSMPNLNAIPQDMFYGCEQLGFYNETYNVMNFNMASTITSGAFYSCSILKGIQLSACQKILACQNIFVGCQLMDTLKMPMLASISGSLSTAFYRTNGSIQDYTNGYNVTRLKYLDLAAYSDPSNVDIGQLIRINRGMEYIKLGIKSLPVPTTGKEFKYPASNPLAAPMLLWAANDTQYQKVIRAEQPYRDDIITVGQCGMLTMANIFGAMCTYPCTWAKAGLIDQVGIDWSGDEPKQVGYFKKTTLILNELETIQYKEAGQLITGFGGQKAIYKNTGFGTAVAADTCPNGPREYCPAIAYLEMPMVKSIPNRCFQNYAMLRKITFGPDCSYISPNAFNKCYNLFEIVSTKDPITGQYLNTQYVFDDHDRVLYRNKDDQKNIVFIGGGSSIEPSKTVVTIGSQYTWNTASAQFSWKRGIRQAVIIQPQLSFIPQSCFLACENLSRIVVYTKQPDITNFKSWSMSTMSTGINGNTTWTSGAVITGQFAGWNKFEAKNNGYTPMSPY